MPLLLPEDYPGAAGVPPRHGTGARLRVGILNIMPRLEAYEPLLLRRLGAAAQLVEPVFIRLETHGYTSSDHAHLDRHYRAFANAGHLDGLVLTGAPVEEIPFEDVHYWRELVAILAAAKTGIRSTLGLCWGGMALGALLDVPKRLFPRKLFGVFDHRVVTPSSLVPRGQSTVACAHSRHSGCDDEALARAARDGRARLLAVSQATGVAVFATPDHRFVAHLGHPEYEAERLVFEWERDRALGRNDVREPHGLDLSRPTTSWRKDSESFFAGWLGLLEARDGVSLLLEPAGHLHR